MKAFFISFIFIFGVTDGELWAQEKQIEIINSNELMFDGSQSEAKKLIGNVILKHENALMYCDSAYLVDKDNKFEAFGHVKIQQGDTMNLQSNHLLYEGKSKLAHADGNVILTRRNMTLKTERLDYNLSSQTADYYTGASMVNGLSQLKSKIGTYFNTSRTVLFRKGVVLVHPEYTIETDSLKYQTDDDIAWLFGFTQIVTKEKDTIQCYSGWYDTKNDRAKFWRKAVISSDGQKLYADSLIYNNKSGKGKGFGNIYFEDPKEHAALTGQYGEYHKKKNLAIISGNPIAIQLSEGDSVFTSADTLIYNGDSLSSGGKKILAFRHVNIYKSDLQGTADSLSYALSDSVIRMYGSPVLFHKENQLSADTIYMFQKNNKPDYLKLLQHSFICSKERGNHFNQIKGQFIHAYFDSSALSRVRVFREGESIYYIKEDSLHYTGINQISCDSMDIFLENQKIKGIKFFVENKGVIHPIKNADPKKMRLRGFNWLPNRRPEKPIIFIKKGF